MVVARITGDYASNSTSDIEKVHARTLALLRCALALTGLVTWIPLAQYGKWIPVAYVSLLFYCVYSVIIALNSHRCGWPAPGRALHWIDALFYGYLVEITADSSSSFFYFFFFAIMMASLSRGLREGVAITIASVAIFLVAIGLNFGPELGIADLGRTWFRPIFLLVFGYLIAFWGGHENLSRRRLRLLYEINNLWNPRFGADHAIGADLQRLLEFYGAGSCILVLKWTATPPRCAMYRASAGKPGQSLKPKSIGEDAAAALLRLPDTLAAFYHDPEASWRNRFRGHRAHDLAGRAQSNAFRDDLTGLANLLEAPAFVTVPYAQRDGTAGRLFVTSPRGGFTRSDIDFLLQVSRTMVGVVENMFLTEELISKASDYERRRISRDLHDTTIQPYIGLMLGLSALQREAGTGNPISPRIAALIDMADMTIRDLRNYAATLKEHASVPGDFLMAAVNKQAERMRRFYDIAIEVKCDVSPQLTGRIAAEASQIIAEGLSNVLRHSSGKSAFVHVLCQDSSLLLRIGNDAAAGGFDTGDGRPGTAEFTPRSINERTLALGGKLFVERGVDGYTIVNVTIPM